MISVAMATCQGERTVGPQLASILDQLGPHDQVVVSDAGSTDRTLEIVESFRDARIEVLPGAPRGRIPHTFERALERCRGREIFLSDQDDLWLPGKVAACREALSGTPVLVVHDALVVDAVGQILSDSFQRARGFQPGFWSNLWKPGYLGCAIAFRRELLARALPFPAEVPMHDWWLGLLAERTGGVAKLDTPLIHHVRHGANANFEPGRSPHPLHRRLAMRIWMLGAIRRRLGRHP